MKKRKVELLVLSDIHLGTYGCHATELLQYLKTIKPKVVVLNGDIIDIWQFSKRYWPKSHMKVVKHIFGWASKGIPVHYICGNHDEMLRKFEGFKIGSMCIKNKLVLELGDKKAWFFHGDVFDVTMQHSKWLAKLGAVGYDTLILINTFANFCTKLMGLGPMSFSKKIKNKVKSAVKFINNFEQTAVDIAALNQYDYVVCGHIHRPEIKEFVVAGQKVSYLNSGDWVESLTALEYNNNGWSLMNFRDQIFPITLHETEEIDSLDKSNKEIFQELLTEFNIK